MYLFSSFQNNLIDSGFLVVSGIEENKYINFKAQDTNNNTYIDYIEWEIPHLSNQTFEIIIITRAEHLNESMDFVMDVYQEVSERDNNWITIQEENYIRVYFEKNLTKENDITIYAKSNQSGKVEVYQTNGLKIADFGTIIDNKKYQIFLKNITHNQDVFDLKITNGGVDFDYIIDPVEDITVYSPENQTTYNVSSVGLNWSVDSNISWCAYKLDDGTLYEIYRNWTYQENGTEHGCEGQWSGSRPCVNVNDTIWGSYGRADIGAGTVAFYYINYTKPSYALNTSVWQVRDNDGYGNLTIPSHCWDYNPDKLILRGRSSMSGALGAGYWWYCYNGSWHILRNNPSGERLYEEAMFWAIQNEPVNTTLIDLDEGYHNVTILCNDSSQNPGQSDYVFFTIDTPPPEITIISPQNGTYTSLNIEFNISSCVIAPEPGCILSVWH
jgi:hypothetical protein